MFKVYELLTVEEAAYANGIVRGVRFPSDVRQILMKARSSRAKASEEMSRFLKGKWKTYGLNWSRPEVKNEKD